MIRLATEHDTEQIAKLWLEMVNFHKQFDPLIFNASEQGMEIYQQSIFNRLNDPNTRVLVAEVDGEIVGYILGMIADIMAEVFMPVRSGFLADIFVIEQYRGQGIGTQLVERLMLWFQSHKITYFEWHVVEKNHKAVRFWKSMGGEVTMLRMRSQIGEIK